MSNPTSQQSPRQKMINIMYIVFLAMLSLAVSIDDGTEEVAEEAGQ